jgi:hypothetical protein
MRVFTKRFFTLGHHDQVQVVNAVLSDLDACVDTSADKAGRERARRMIRRIERKAVEFGIFPNPHQLQPNGIRNAMRFVQDDYGMGKTTVAMKMTTDGRGHTCGATWTDLIS